MVLPGATPGGTWTVMSFRGGAGMGATAASWGDTGAAAAATGAAIGTGLAWTVAASGLLLPPTGYA